MSLSADISQKIYHGRNTVIHENHAINIVFKSSLKLSFIKFR